ncbi:MAG: OmpH family outer membrane protein [Akkermansiaceae bacterium]|nr:OmpH family outer membrane protein [Akkermansiaceae bacterium]MDG2322488.1 OmpH family outer membrane protein [Akkermansiaceae bacterium]
MKRNQFLTRLTALAALAAVLLLPLTASADPKMKLGTVNMTKLLIEYHLTKAARAEENIEREDIKKDDQERIVAIKAMSDEMRLLDAELRDPSLAEAKRRASLEKLKLYDSKIKALSKERDEFLKRRGNALNQKMASIMNEIRIEVVSRVAAHVKDSTDVDFVVDSSGLTTAQIPFLLYARERVDLTDDMLKLLKKEAPAETAEEKKTN